jgi:hypothetical protein
MSETQELVARFMALVILHTLPTQEEMDEFLAAIKESVIQEASVREIIVTEDWTGEPGEWPDNVVWPLGGSLKKGHYDIIPREEA